MPDPTLTDVSKLPIWGQIGGLIAILVAISAAFREGFKPKENKASDTVVVSGAFADSKPIAALAEAVKELRESVDERGRETCEALEDVKRAVGRSNSTLDDISVDIRKGVKVRIEPGA